MQFASRTLIIAAVIIGLAVPAFCADVAKIGVVDIQRLLELSDAGKDAREKINVQGKGMAEDLKHKGAEIEELKAKLERAMVMSKEQREEKEREFRIKVNDFKAARQKFEEEVRELNQNLLGKITKDVMGIVEEIGKKEGYLLIIEKKQAGVVYSPNTIDITDQVIQAYNTMYAKTGKLD